MSPRNGAALRQRSAAGGAGSRKAQLFNLQGRPSTSPVRKPSGTCQITVIKGLTVKSSCKNPSWHRQGNGFPGFPVGAPVEDGMRLTAASVGALKLDTD